MHALDQLGAYHGLLLAAGLLLAGAGLPLPLTPMLLAAGALAAAGKVNLAAAILIPPLCLAIGDSLWFFLGRRIGQGILSTVCRVTLERDTCIRKSQDTFKRHGLRALLVSRFVPGLSTLASPMAGATGKRFIDFLPYEFTGAVIYTSLFTALGYAFANQMDYIIQVIGGAGERLTIAIIAIFIVYAGFKLLTRWWLIRKSETLAIAATDVQKKRTANPTTFMMIDLRGPNDLSADPFIIPDAKMWRERDLYDALKKVPPETSIVLFCACPNQASSTRVALALRRKGFKNVWPLRDGLIGWRAAKLPLEPLHTPAMT